MAILIRGDPVYRLFCCLEPSPADDHVVRVDEDELGGEKEER